MRLFLANLLALIPLLGMGASINCKDRFQAVTAGPVEQIRDYGDCPHNEEENRKIIEELGQNTEEGQQRAIIFLESRKNCPTAGFDRMGGVREAYFDSCPAHSNLIMCQTITPGNDNLKRFFELAKMVTDAKPGQPAEFPSNDPQYYSGIERAIPSLLEYNLWQIHKKIELVLVWPYFVVEKMALDPRARGNLQRIIVNVVQWGDHYTRWLVKMLGLHLPQLQSLLQDVVLTVAASTNEEKILKGHFNAIGSELVKKIMETLEADELVAQLWKNELDRMHKFLDSSFSPTTTPTSDVPINTIVDHINENQPGISFAPPPPPPPPDINSPPPVGDGQAGTPKNEASEGKGKPKKETKEQPKEKPKEETQEQLNEHFRNCLEKRLRQMIASEDDESESEDETSVFESLSKPQKELMEKFEEIKGKPTLKTTLADAWKIPEALVVIEENAINTARNLDRAKALVKLRISLGWDTLPNDDVLLEMIKDKVKISEAQKQPTYMFLAYASGDNRGSYQAVKGLIKTAFNDHRYSKVVESFLETIKGSEVDLIFSYWAKNSELIDLRDKNAASNLVNHLWKALGDGKEGLYDKFLSHFHRQGYFEKNPIDVKSIEVNTIDEFGDELRGNLDDIRNYWKKVCIPNWLRKVAETKANIDNFEEDKDNKEKDLSSLVKVYKDWQLFPAKLKDAYEVHLKKKRGEQHRKEIERELDETIKLLNNPESIQEGLLQNQSFPEIFETILEWAEGDQDYDMLSYIAWADSNSLQRAINENARNLGLESSLKKIRKEAFRNIVQHAVDDKGIFDEQIAEIQKRLNVQKN